MNSKQWKYQNSELKQRCSDHIESTPKTDKKKWNDHDTRSKPNKYITADRSGANIPILPSDAKTFVKLNRMRADNKFDEPLQGVKIPEFGYQIYPVRLFCLCEEALQRAFDMSRVGIRWKDVNMHIYLETAKRLKRIYNYYKQYPDGVIEQYKSSMRPGIIIYSKRMIKNVKGIQIYKSSKTNIPELGTLLASGRSIRITENVKFDGYEMYVYHKEDWPDVWYQSLPEWTDSMSIESPVLDVFNANAQVVKLGPINMLYGLPQWYRVLESSVTGVELFLESGIINISTYSSMILCDPVSPYKSDNNYIDCEEKLDSVARTSCLVVRADRSSQNYNADLVNYAISKRYYVLMLDTFAWVKIKCNNSTMIVHCKLSKELSIHLQYHVIVGKMHDLKYKDLFFDLIFKTYKPNSSDYLNIYRGADDKFEVRMVEPSGGVISNSSVSTVVKSIVDLGYPNFRMAIVGSKGSMKSAFIRYVTRCAQRIGKKIVCYDSDAYGVWVSKMKGFKINEDRVDKNDSFIYKLAESYLLDMRVKSYFSLSYEAQCELLTGFGVLYQKLLSDEDLGIKKWLVSIEDEMMQNDYVLYFLHSSLEQRTMFANDAGVVLKEYIDTQKVIVSRVLFKSDVKGLELMMYDFYNSHINTMIPRVDYVDILRVLEFDDCIEMPGMTTA